jgi:hypothetical protein
MMAVLPGIDANDESKTAAVFQFYTAVMASLPVLRGIEEEEEGGEGGGLQGQAGSTTCYKLPLYLEDWVEQVGNLGKGQRLAMAVVVCEWGGDAVCRGNRA